MTRNNKINHHRVNLENRKNYAKSVATSTIGKGGFNPKDARYRSQKALPMRKNEILTSSMIQVLPVLLLVLLLVVKYVI